MSHVREHCAKPEIIHHGRKATPQGQMWACECGKVWTLQPSMMTWSGGGNVMHWVETGLTWKP